MKDVAEVKSYRRGYYRRRARVPPGAPVTSGELPTWLISLQSAEMMIHIKREASAAASGPSIACAPSCLMQFSLR